MDGGEPVVESSRTSIAPLRVLLIEENAITRRLARLALESNGIAVSEADDAQTALSFLAANGVDLVLQDLVLPDMDGFDLLTRIRELPGGAEMPIVALSGLLSKFEESRVSSVGFNDVITKPVEPGHLLQIVRAHLPTEEPREVKFGRGRRLLVADDDPVQRKLLCFRLRRLGFDTATAADGNEALTIARRSHPDAIISDVMMPGLDGFGLCVAVREDPALARTPLLLITNSYIEEVDRELARKAGASGFVVRTPGMREVAEALRQSLSQTPRAPVPREPAATLEGEWSRRVMSQLERQVSLNAGIAQRCATLSAELSILSGISDALARQRHIEDALVDVLGTCFDASGITSSALYLRDSDRIVLHKFGAWGQSTDEEVRTFFGHPELLANFMAVGKTVRVPSESAPAALGETLRGAGMTSAILAPVLRRGEVIGALLMGSRTSELVDDDRLLFAEGVATQISQALALSHSFREMDLSERRSREQAAVLRSILESIAEGVVVTNREGEVVIWNLAAEGILRKGAITVPARDWTEHYGLFLPDTLMPVPPSQSPFLRAMAGDSVDSMELVLRHDVVPQGRHISISARPLKDENDDVAGAVAVLRDVTAERATQTQLMVTDRLASVGMLAAGVAHEINNPLAAVLGNLEVALERLSDFGVAPEKQAELTELTAALRDARDGASRIRQIVRDLKVFSRDEKEKHGPVDVHRVLDLALRTASNEVRHRARVVRSYGAVPPVEGDESRLGQVFLNLIVNAAQAIPDGRADENEIRITTQLEGGHVVVDIADTGTGIAPDAMKRLFTPFFTTKPVGIGTGLGLSICHRLVAASGGQITVDSTLGKGTVFHVALRPSHAGGVVATPTPPRGEPAKRRARILIVDDEPAVVEVIRRILMPEHDCLGVSSGKEALVRIPSGGFDVIFCDLMMPVMTGMDLHAELFVVAPEEARKIVFLTGGAFTARARAFLTEVPNRHLHKPFDAAELKAVVNARLSQIEMEAAEAPRVAKC